MAIEVSKGGGMMITGEHINVYRLLTLRMGLRAEARGMKLTRGPSALSIVKKEFGLRGNRESVTQQFEAMLEKMKAERKPE